MKQSKNIGGGSVQRIKAERKKIPSVTSVVRDLLHGDKIALSRAITLIESTTESDRIKAEQLLQRCLGRDQNSIRIGITGVPGVGKSTFIEALGKHLISLGYKVAVLTVDPSSTLSKGSILGDKTRMPQLVQEPDAYIRPSPSGPTLGGVARRTREAMTLCEAAGFTIILVETVGVGQSEIAVHSMVDFFLLLQLAGAGDELQGMKRGIIEMADAIAINKADGNNVREASKARSAFEQALHLYPPKYNGWQPRVMTCSALRNQGIDDIWEMISHYVDVTKDKDSFVEKRRAQNKKWFQEAVEEALYLQFYQDKSVQKKLESLVKQVETGKKTPFKAAAELLGKFEERH